MWPAFTFTFKPECSKANSSYPTDTTLCLMCQCERVLTQDPLEVGIARTICLECRVNQAVEGGTRTAGGRSWVGDAVSQRPCAHCVFCVELLIIPGPAIYHV